MIKSLILERLKSNVEYVMNVTYNGPYTKMDVYDWIKRQKLFNPNVEVILADNPNTKEHEVAQVFIKMEDVLVDEKDEKKLLAMINASFQDFMSTPRKKSIVRKLLGY